MKKRENRTPGFFGMGASLLLTVLLVVMLVTFSLLSLATARNDLRASERLAQHRTEYYEANNQAERILWQLSQGQTPELPVTWEGDTVSFQVPAAEGQVLMVKLKWTDGAYTVRSWKIQPESRTSGS